jgi:hypothetical protein
MEAHRGAMGALPLHGKLITEPWIVTLIGAMVTYHGAIEAHPGTLWLILEPGAIKGQ